MPDYNTNLSVAGLATQIVSAHVGHNNTAPENIPPIINLVFGALMGCVREDTPAAVTVAPSALVPAVPIRKSIFADYIICLEDGKKLKMLKRHLAAAYNLSPEQYREKWGLAEDYPMVAPNYAKHRSDLAKGIGLGRGRSRLPETPAETENENAGDAVPVAPQRPSVPRQALRVAGAPKSKKAARMRRVS